MASALSMKSSFGFLAILSISLASVAVRADSTFNQDFIKTLIVNGGLKQAVKSYIQAQSKEVVHLKADQADPLAVYFFGSDRNRQALLKDIDDSAYEADQDGSRCSELHVPGQLNEPVEARTQFEDRGAKICFNIAGIEQNYGSRNTEDGMKLLISYALHEHAHHFQKDPASDLSLRASLEHQAYDFQAFVLSTASSGISESLQYSRTLVSSQITRDALPSSERDDVRRPLVAGDKVVFFGAKCENSPKAQKDPWSGLSYDFCTADDAFGSILGDQDLLPSDLTVVATRPNPSGEQDVAVAGMVNGKPVSLLLPDRLLPRAFGKTSKRIAVGDIGYVVINYVNIEVPKDVISIYFGATGIAPENQWTIRMKVRVVGIDDSTHYAPVGGMLLVEPLEIADKSFTGPHAPDLLDVLEKRGFHVNESLHKIRITFGKIFEKARGGY